jgi:hypothetical protein
MKEFKIQPVLEIFNNYKHKWLQHVRRMDRYRLPYAIMKTTQKERGIQAEETPGLLHRERNGSGDLRPCEGDDDELYHSAFYD